MFLHGCDNKSFRDLPTISCSTLSTPRSQASDLISSSDSIQTPDTIFTPSHYKQGLGEALDWGSLSCSTALIDGVTPPDERLVPLATRSTPTLTSTNSTVPETRSLIPIIQSANLNHCLSIVKTLHSPSLHQRVSDISSYRVRSHECYRFLRTSRPKSSTS